jgi:hypothetical protein
MTSTAADIWQTATQLFAPAKILTEIKVLSFLSKFFQLPGAISKS